MIKNFFYKGIQKKLIVNVVLIHAILMGIVVYDTIDNERSFITNQLSQKGVDITTISATNASFGLLNNDLVALQDLVANIESIQGFHLAFIIDRNQTIRASSKKEYFNKKLTDAISLEMIENLKKSSESYIQKTHNGVVDTLSKVYAGKRHIGYVRILLDKTQTDVLLQNIINEGIIYILFAIFLGALFAWLSVRGMTKGLSVITQTAKKISEHKFDTKLELPTSKFKDEISDVIIAFSVMQNSIAEYIEEIKKSQERYAALFKSNKAVELIIDPQSRSITDCNDAALAFYGYQKEQLVGMGIDNINTLTLEEIQDEMQKAIASKKNYFNFKHRVASGEVKDVEVYSGPLKIGNETFLYSIVHDISEKVKIEHEKSLIQERLNLALEASKDGLWDWNLVDNSVYFSPNYKRMLGYEDDELENDFTTWENKLHPDDKEKSLQFVQKFLKSDADHYEQQFRMQHKNGEYIIILARAKKIFNENAQAIRLIGTHLDITELKHLEEKVNTQREFLQTVIDGIDTTLMVINTDYSIALMNETARKMINESYVQDMLNPKCYEISHNRDVPCDGKEHPCPLAEVIQSKTGTKTIHTHITKDGKKEIVEIISTPLKNKDGEVYAIVESAHNITALVETRDKMQYQAEHDSLTGLPNRMLFLDRLEQSIRYAKRADEKVAILFMDLDHFKEVNDTLGHAKGDKLLIEVADIIRKEIRSSDTVARLGGDEFTVIVDKITSSDVVVDIVQKIMEKLKKPQLVSNHELYTSFSIGIAIYPDDGNNGEELLKNADIAMYKSKIEGRNRYHFYTDDMTKKALERVTLEREIRAAIQNREFEVYYQPQVDTQDDTIVGIEALVRWRNSENKLVEPTVFIPLAEETGMIIEIDKLVREIALKDLFVMKKEGMLKGRLSLNITTIELNHKGFYEDLMKQIELSGCKPEWIEIEVTESQIMKNSEVAINVLTKLDNIGINVSIDDFGTGYSSLSYIKQLPVKKLKIDQSFVRDVVSDNNDREIIRAIIAMSKSLQLEVLAEGVETLEQKDLLLIEGCNRVQGFYYYKPMSFQDFMKSYSF